MKLNKIYNIVYILIKNIKEHIKVHNMSFLQQEEWKVMFFSLHPVQFKDTVSTSNSYSGFLLVSIYNIYQVFSNKCSHMIYCLADNCCISSYSMLHYVFSSMLSSKVFCRILEFWWETESKLPWELQYLVKSNSVACF